MRTRFEDLSNELFYEIFDFLDGGCIIEIFSNLNTRFNKLIVHSSLPLKLNFSLLSKTTFQYQCNSILIPNIHRITSLRFSHHLIIDHFFTECRIDSSFIRLQTLALYNSKSDDLIPIINSLATLPRLCSLTITTIERVRSPNDVYCSILRLPYLNYCKLSFGLLDPHYDFPLHSSECSPIENLIINEKCYLDRLNDFLLHMPNLKHLSCEISTLNTAQVHLSVISLNLISICLKLENTSFDEFQWLISGFSHQLRVLRLSTEHDLEFLNADRWQQFILGQMPYLNRFDLQHQLVIDESIEGYQMYHSLINKFRSSFWTDRNWFFTHQHYKSRHFTSYIMFYSTQPYR